MRCGANLEEGVSASVTSEAGKFPLIANVGPCAKPSRSYPESGAYDEFVASCDVGYVRYDEGLAGVAYDGLTSVKGTE